MEIPELNVFKSFKNNLFNTKDKYIIPLYQRDFAWSDTEINQLIEDINGVDSNEKYCIGSLVVYKRNNTYEVIDGQQRLTTLYLLLSCLGCALEHNLTFACREKSNYTLENVEQLIEKNNQILLDEKKIKTEIRDGIDVIKGVVNSEDFNKADFTTKLKNVVIYRIEVPENTDLNRYFEIMNTRGEQLEAQDIVKADLMSELNDNEKEAFAMLWNACSDMTGYLQMHFDTNQREYLFSNNWESFQFDKWGDFYSAFCNNSKKTYKKNSYSISDIIQESFKVDSSEIIDDDDNRVRFESIIEFPHFLLHSLKSFVASNNITSKNRTNLLPELLDDKKIIESFTDVSDRGIYRNQEIDKSTFAKKFIIHLTLSRFYFDKFILKREYDNENSDGEWSLKELKKSKKKTPYFINTVFRNSGERNDENKYRERHDNILMMEAACRVSYTSPKGMHWITKALIEIHNDSDHLGKFEENFEKIISKAVKNDFFDQCDGDSFEKGVDTPHIVFNYLDYLLWKEDKKKYDNFIFEFRNSVEHWYPRNPSEGSFSKWENGVDTFGNLCLLQRNINSKFSNLAPSSKSKYEQIKKGSIKLRIMKEITESVGDEGWKKKSCKEHEKTMIQKLRNACDDE